ncbi:MAG: MFS transporter [Peptococcaceae bacterium]|jgi:MFS family permease|nr:MFS transporter [Peptococcaceae bacterium]
MDSPRGYRRDFVLISLITFLAYTSNFFFIPFLPVYMKDAGYTQVAIGVAVGAFSVTSVFLRPLVGGLMDCWSRRVFVVAGSLVLAALPLAYPFAHSLTGLVLLRMVHGIGISFVVTAGMVVIADIAPPGRLSQSTGNYMSSISLALILAPMLAERVMGTRPSSLWPFVLWPAAIALPALGLSLLIRETRCSPAPAATKTLRASLSSFGDHRVWVPTVTFFSCQITQGAIFAFLPLFTLSWPDPAVAGVYFALYAAAIISVRLAFGHLADRYGRHRIIIPALVLSSLAVGLVFESRGPGLLLTAAVVYGIGYGLAYPSLNAFVVDHVDDRLRGSALGLFGTALGGGTLLGPVIGGFLVQSAGLATMFLWLALAPLAGALLFVLTFLYRKPSLPERPRYRAHTEPRG